MDMLRLLGGREAMLFYALVFSGLFSLAAGSGHIEVLFLYYSDTCTEHWNTNACDPMFSFCLSTPQTGSLSVDNCNYASTGESSDHFHNTNNIDLEHLSDIKGHPNPWIVRVDRFLEPLVMLVIKVTDVDVFGKDDMQTWGTVLNETVWSTKEQAVWAERVMSQNSHTMRFRVRMYCDPNYYTTSCDVMCVADDSIAGHYVCEPDTGRRICMSGWQGDQCTDDIDECALDYCYSGECTNLPGDYECICPHNYTGKNCSVMAGPCHSNPCQNGGECFELTSEYVFFCNCTEEWEGNTCNNSRDPCQLHPCLHNGSCPNSQNGTDYNCTCLHAHAREGCLVTETDVTAVNITSVETTSTSTFTVEPSTFPVESSTFIVEPFTAKIVVNERSEYVTESTTGPTPTEKGGFTTSSMSVVDVELVNQKEDDSHFKPWYTAIIVAVVLIALIVVLVVVIKRRRKSKHNVSPPVVPAVSYDGTDVSFDNGVYSNVNRSNSEAERQSRELPAVPLAASTPTEGNLFNPTKPTSYVEADEIGATVNRVANHSEQKKKSVTIDTSTLHVRPVAERAECNPYADFQSLTEGHKAAEKSGDQEGSHYNDLHEVGGSMPRDSEAAEYSDLTFNFDLQATPVVRIPSSAYDTPPNNSSYYATPATRSSMLQPEPVKANSSALLRDTEEIEFTNPVLNGEHDTRTHVTSAAKDGDVDSSDDDADNLQEDLAKLRQDVKHNVTT